MKKTEDKKAVVIGKAKVDIKSFMDYAKSDEYAEFISAKNLWTPYLYQLQGAIQGVYISNLYENAKNYGETYKQRKFAELDEYIKSVMPDVERPFNLIYVHKLFVIVSFGGLEPVSQYLFPKQFVDFEMYKDYSELSVKEIRALNCSNETQNSSNLSVIASDSKLSFISEKTQKQRISNEIEEIKSITNEMDDVKNARKGELAELQRQIDEQIAALEAKKKDLLAVLEAKQAEMEEKKNKLEQELFVLESEIYSIRCYLGETVDFIKIKAGKNAGVDVPVTLFQKIRYLDEELGKMISIYDFDFREVKYFESFLKHNDEAVNIFCPNDKCVSLVRISKSNIQYGFTDTVYGPMLEKYDAYHGKTIGILIRNGENLYIGWTDEEKVNIPEDFFYSPQSKIYAADEAPTVETTTKEEFVSRYFVMSVLQGVLDNENILPLPEKVSVAKPSKYIVLSYADKWVTDNRFGNLRDIVDKTKGHYKKGNYILSIERLNDGRYDSYYGNRDFERDRNNSRRTGDVSISNGKIYRINLVDKVYYNVHTVKTEIGELQRWSEQYGWHKYTDEDFKKRNVTLIKTEQEYSPEVYVSLPKSNFDYIYNGGRYTPRQREARANFRLFDGEFIDLTYLNSVWLKYVITTRRLGYSESKAEGNFANMIRYLNIALQFIIKREIKEAELIKKFYPDLDSISEWQIKLSEWKLKHEVNNLTEYQAKRFSKTLEVQIDETL